VFFVPPFLTCLSEVFPLSPPDEAFFPELAWRVFFSAPFTRTVTGVPCLVSSLSPLALFLDLSRSSSDFPFYTWRGFLAIFSFSFRIFPGGIESFKVEGSEGGDESGSSRS